MTRLARVETTGDGMVASVAMTRLARVALSLLAALAIALGAAPAATASPSTEAIGSASYHYDAPASGEVWTDTAAERGPPITHDRDAYATVDRWSRHVSARSGGAAPATTTDYDTHPALVQVAWFTRTTRERVLGADGKSVVFDRAGVAANGADDLLRLSTKDSWGRLDTLDDHFMRHGAALGASSADDYARMASEFYQRGLKSGLPTKLDPKTGVVRIYDPATNSFGSYNAAGTTKTFYKPDPASHGYATNWDYWLAQPGYAP